MSIFMVNIPECILEWRAYQEAYDFVISELKNKRYKSESNYPRATKTMSKKYNPRHIDEVPLEWLKLIKDALYEKIQEEKMDTLVIKKIEEMNQPKEHNIVGKGLDAWFDLTENMITIVKTKIAFDSDWLTLESTDKNRKKLRKLCDFSAWITCAFCAVIDNIENKRSVREKNDEVYMMYRDCFWKTKKKKSLSETSRKSALKKIRSLLHHCWSDIVIPEEVKKRRRKKFQRKS